jgi:prolyl oligopeptidase
MKLPPAVAPLALGAAAIAAAAAPPAPPPSRTEKVAEKLHGAEVADPYRWLEGDNAKAEAKGAMTPEVAAWTDAQNAYTRAVLDALPGRKAIEDRLRPLLEIGSVSLPEVRGERLFFSRRDGKQNQPVHYLRMGPKGSERVLLDPARLDPSGLTAVEWTSPSEDGKLFAYGTYRSGDEQTTLYVMEVDTGKLRPDTIPGKTRGCDWLPDGSGFFYRNLSDPGNPYSGQVRFHRLGQPVAKDSLALRQLTPEEDKALATTYGPYAMLSKDGRWLELLYFTGTSDNDLWVMPVKGFLETGEVRKVPITVGLPARSLGPILGDTLYMQTNLDAPLGKVVKVDLNRPGREAWTTLVPERPGVAIEDVSLAQGLLVVQTMEKASTRLELHGLDGTPRGQLALPGLGTAQVAARHDATAAYLAFTSYNYPTTIFQVDLGRPTQAPVLWERPAAPVDPGTVEVEQEWFSSKDGTRVSMFVVHRKGLKLDGNNPTLLYGYGGFTASETPVFLPTLFQWFEAGGVFADANLRGGGEYGEAWHRDGMLEKKQNVFDDFVAAAEHLIARGYTKPERLAIEGGSNGGLLTGAAVVQRPDLFRAALVEVPLLDMLRYQDFLMARYWVPEYGSAEDPAQFKTLFAYSPYHHVKDGVRYPAVLLTAGENDARVHPMHARKMAARLQAVAAGVEAARPVLLWVDRDAGHGQGKPLDLRLRDRTDEIGFVMWQLGMLATQ